MNRRSETYDRIVDTAFKMASKDGLAGLSIGGLADALRLSKSGLFAHFGSKENLEVAVLQAAADRFTDSVLRPAFREPRGVARIRAVHARWLDWVDDPARPGGCLLMAAGMELDDKPGPVRDQLVADQRTLGATLAKSARMAVETGEFGADLDPEQFAFEWYALLLAYQRASRLLADPVARTRCERAFTALLGRARA